MKTLIYQYWDGTIKDSCRAGIGSMKRYADRIGATHIFEENPKFLKRQNINLGKYTPHYGSFKPILSRQYDDYDYIMFADTDIFPLEKTVKNIFERFSRSNSHIAMAQEPLEPLKRSLTRSKLASKLLDERWSDKLKREWGCNLPRTKDGLLKVYNSGVVLYSREGIEKFRKDYIEFESYINLMKSSRLSNFYQGDQNYLHALIFTRNFKFWELNHEWNVLIRSAGHTKPLKNICDPRTENSLMVHMQIIGSGNLSGEQLLRMVNNPIKDWGIQPNGKPYIKGDCLTGNPI